MSAHSARHDDNVVDNYLDYLEALRSKPWRTRCNACGRRLTPQEVRRMDSDIDFVEHHGHLIGRDTEEAYYRDRARRGLGNYYGR